MSVYLYVQTVTSVESRFPARKKTVSSSVWRGSVSREDDGSPVDDR
jgi:hypothetical protein